MKRLFPFLLLFAATVHNAGAQATQNVTVNPSGTGNGTFNTRGITNYIFPPGTTVTIPVTIQGAVADVTVFGAKGDGVTDDRPAVQAAVDYLLSFPATVPKTLLFPRPAAYYLFASGQTIGQRYPLNTWNGSSPNVSCIYLPNAKNFTLKGDSGRVPIVMSASITNGTYCFNIDANDDTQPFVTWSPSSGYKPSLQSLSAHIAPVLLGSDYVTLISGDITKFMVGDLMQSGGFGQMVSTEKIVATDATTGRVYVERPINEPFAQVTWNPAATATAGATKVYIPAPAETAFYQAFAEGATGLSLTVAGTTATPLVTTGTGPGNDAGGYYVTLANAIPTGGTVSGTTTITLTQAATASSITAVGCETFNKYVVKNLTYTVGGAQPYSFVSLNDPLWCVLPEKVTFQNLSISTTYPMAPIIEVPGYDLSIDNCTLTGNAGVVTLFTNDLDGLYVNNSTLQQVGTMQTGEQYVTQSTKHVRFNNDTLINNGWAMSENGDDIECTDTTFVNNAGLTFSSGSNVAFGQIGPVGSAHFLRCRFSLSGYHNTNTSTGGEMFNLVNGGTSVWTTSTVSFDKCRFDLQPGLNAAGTGEQIAAGVFLGNPYTFSVANSTINARNFATVFTGTVSGLTFVNNDVNMTYGGQGNNLFFNFSGGASPVYPSLVANNRFNNITNSGFKLFEFGGDLFPMTFSGNTYNGFNAQIFYVYDNGVSDGLSLSNITIQNETAINSLGSFSWYNSGQYGIIPLQTTASDGVRTWKSKTTPKGGLINVGDIIIYQNGAGVTATETCTASGAMSSGSWSNATNYLYGQWVTGSDSKVYECIQANGPGTVVKDPTTPNPAYWQLMASQVATFSP